MFDEEMRAEDDSTENGEDRVEIVFSKVNLRRCLTRGNASVGHVKSFH